MFEAGQNGAPLPSHHTRRRQHWTLLKSTRNNDRLINQEAIRDLLLALIVVTYASRRFSLAYSISISIPFLVSFASSALSKSKRQEKRQGRCSLRRCIAGISSNQPFPLLAYKMDLPRSSTMGCCRERHRAKRSSSMFTLLPEQTAICTMCIGIPMFPFSFKFSIQEMQEQYGFKYAAERESLFPPRTYQHDCGGCCSSYMDVSHPSIIQ